MAEPTWPESVPGPEWSSLRWRPAFDNVIRSQMDIGAKMRRRATRVPELMGFRIPVTAAQMQTLLDFYEVTLSCVLPFHWHEFRKPDDTTTLVVYRFMKRPQFEHWTIDTWMAEIELEVLTTFNGTHLLNIEGLST